MQRVVRERGSGAAVREPDARADAAGDQRVRHRAADGAGARRRATSTRSAPASPSCSSPSCRTASAACKDALGKVGQLRAAPAEAREERARARRSCCTATTSTSSCCPGSRPGRDDGGVFLNLGLTHTKHPETGARNLGMYRLQQQDERTVSLHWQIHKDSTSHARGRRAARRAAAGRDRVRLPAGGHLRRQRAAAGRDRRVPVRRLPAARTGRAGRLHVGAAAGAGRRAGRARGLGRARASGCPKARSATTPASTRRSSRSRSCGSRR